MAVDGGVAAAINDGAALGRDLEPVAMPPHRTRFSRQVAACRVTTQAWRIGIKVTAQITLVLGIAPKEGWHTRQGLGHDQLAHLVDDRLALFVEGMHRHAQQAALHFTRHHGQLSVTAHIRTRVGATRNIAPPNIGLAHPRISVNLLKLRGAPLLHLGAQRRAGGTQSPHRVQTLNG